MLAEGYIHLQFLSMAATLFFIREARLILPSFDFMVLYLEE